MSPARTARDVAPAGIDRGRLNDWLAPRLDVRPEELDYSVLTAGRSNLTYLVSQFGEPRWVLRRPPLGHVERTAHDVLRESRIYRALAETPVPVPRVVASSDESGPLGVPMFVMEYVAGVAMNGPDDFARVAPAARGPLAEELVRVLAEIHQVDLESVGLEQLRRPGSLVERQLRRWLAVVDGLADRGTLPEPDLQALRSVHATLVAGRPTSAGSALCHGDYKPNNLIFGPDGQVVAVLDWELTSVGEVGTDLGWLTALWGSELTSRWAPAPGSGYPTPAELAAAYEERGVVVDDLGFYQALGLWKLACIRADVNARLRSGAMGDLGVTSRDDDDGVQRLSQAAAELLADRTDHGD